MINYTLKLKALLHDPIHKVWCFSNKNHIPIAHENEISTSLKHFHEKVAEDLFRFLFSDSLKSDLIQQADSIASAFSRIIVSPDIADEEKKTFEEENSVFLGNSIFIDAFSGNQNSICIGNPDNHNEVKEVFEKLGNLSFDNEDTRAQFYFLFLWRFLPEIFPWINFHPADSRVPNHSIYDHLVQTSAVTTCLENNDYPAFLLFTIGPVQQFIASARKTSDLWAGSFLLSYLIYKSIEVIMEELGPDHIVFPNLIEQPMVNTWLYKKLKDKDVDIPCFKDWKDKWEKAKFNTNNSFDDELTIANIPNRFLAIVPQLKAKELGKKCKEKVFEVLNALVRDMGYLNLQSKGKIDIIKLKDHIQSYFNTYWIVLPWGNDVNNVINEYQNLITTANEEGGIVKLIQLIKDYPYYKDTNIGITYSILVELAERFLAARKNIRDFMVIQPQAAKKCSICGEFEIAGKDTDEELCGVCLLKRNLPEIMKINLNLKEKIRYPSTSEIPTVKYKNTLSDNVKEELKKKLEDLKINTKYVYVSVPKLKDNSLYFIDGQFLMESTYRNDYLEKECEIEINDKKLQEIKRFLKDNRINPPVYYAILVMDGDEMGKWIKGDKMNVVKNLLHPKSVEALQNFWKKDNYEDLNIILSSTHPMSPSFHNAFSRRLSDFALNKVRTIVEEEFYGKLIYAGGDDVMAFLPVDDALNCAYRLQEEFKSVVSNRASMSAGIVFVHHKYPLQLALHKAREAESLAKNKYGRNACCIKFIRNSGEERTIGFNWELKIDFIDDIIKMYKLEKISSKFAYDFMEVVEEVSPESNNVKLKTIIRNELIRIYKHKQKKEREVDAFLNKMLKVFDTWQHGYQDFANMFIIGRFIAQSGVEA